MDHDALHQLAQDISNCRKCFLHVGRNKALPGAGACTTGIVMVGEAPAEKEDLGGRPQSCMPLMTFSSFWARSATSWTASEDSSMACEVCEDMRLTSSVA